MPARRHRPPSPGSDVEYPAAQMHLVLPSEPVTARVVRNEICTAGPKAASFVRHMEFDVTGTPLEGAFLAGQSFGVIPPGNDDAGRPHKVRLYSVCSPSHGEDGRGRVVSTTVKRSFGEDPQTHRLFLGVASNYLCDRQVGDEVMLSGPNGKRFLLPSRPEEHEFLFLATGTGIAPFRGMVQDLHARAPGARATLIAGASYKTDLLYHEDLLAFADASRAFAYEQAISREGDRREYVQHRLAAIGESLLPGLCSGRTLIYVAGVAGMELGVAQALARIIPRESLGEYIMCDDETLGEIDNWTRRMLHKEVRLTRRVHLEVY